MTKELEIDILKWDVKSWLKPLRYWEEKVDWTKINDALEIGAENGGLSLWLALKGKRVVCTDLTETKLKALPLHKKYGVEHLVQYVDADATHLPFENKFDLVVFKSVVGGIGRDGNSLVQQKVFEEVYKSLKPGGVLLFAENLKGSFLHQFFRKKFRKWGSSWHYFTLTEMKSYLKDYKESTLLTTGVVGTFGRSEQQKRFMAGFDTMLFNFITPKSHKYICYGIAIK